MEAGLPSSKKRPDDLSEKTYHAPKSIAKQWLPIQNFKEPKIIAATTIIPDVSSV
jgi:hypothetical protein